MARKYRSNIVLYKLFKYSYIMFYVLRYEGEHQEKCPRSSWYIHIFEISKITFQINETFSERRSISIGVCLNKLKKKVLTDQEVWKCNTIINATNCYLYFISPPHITRSHPFTFAGNALYINDNELNLLIAKNHFIAYFIELKQLPLLYYSKYLSFTKENIVYYCWIFEKHPKI